MKRRKWTEIDLVEAARDSRSIRQVLGKLKLREAGGNYSQIQKFLHIYNINTSHFKGRGWNKGSKIPFQAKISLENILQKGSTFQSFKLKARLFRDGLKKRQCELCGWKEQASDGRIPVELDHINGDRSDNRFENLRVLCPNCHSLQPTHRGLNSH